MCPANERQGYIVTSSFIGWAHSQNDPWKPEQNRWYWWPGDTRSQVIIIHSIDLVGYSGWLNIRAVDDMATQGARSSSAMVLTWLVILDDSISWLLMTWRHKELGHHQPWYWLGWLFWMTQYHGCWWPGDTRSQVIISHGIDLVGYSGWLNIMAVDDLATQGARSSSFIVLTWLVILDDSISWLLMTWRHKEPGHHQPWYWLGWLFWMTQYHGCWWPGDTRSQVIIIHSIDLVGYSGWLNIRAVDDLATQGARSSSAMVLTWLVILDDSISRLLMTWWHKEPGHHQPWYWLGYSGLWWPFYSGLSACLSVLMNAVLMHLVSVATLIYWINS